MNDSRIVSDLVTLTPPPAGFAACLRDWYADPAVTRYLSVRFPPTFEAMEEYLRKLAASNANVIWAILADECPVGIILVKDIEWQKRKASLGISIGDTSVWGKGYGYAATFLATRFAFEELGLEKLRAGAFAENVASRRMLEKVGYGQYGLARHDEYRHGHWHDTWLCELLRDEWTLAPAL
jgi:ribosomal-protein-alanine N-acetyltransferase